MPHKITEEIEDDDYETMLNIIQTIVVLISMKHHYNSFNNINLFLYNNNNTFFIIKSAYTSI